MLIKKTNKSEKKKKRKKEKKKKCITWYEKTGVFIF